MLNNTINECREELDNAYHMFNHATGDMVDYWCYRIKSIEVAIDAYVKAVKKEPVEAPNLQGVSKFIYQHYNKLKGALSK